MKTPMTIVIAGASGYIGQALIPRLIARFPDARIHALSRTPQSEHPRVTWHACDLFSLKAIEKAAPAKVDLAYYLVHSMGPTAQMDQGSFADYDLILADNFARAMKARGVEHLIYLGGLVPGIPVDSLSLHLRSRLEVERTFASSRLPLTVFRAGLIIGTAGSSFQILSKLVKRLPVMICPKWTQTLTTPVDLEAVLHALVTVALEPAAVGRTYDLAGCRPITYVQMMRETARLMGKRRLFLTVPLFTPTLSRLWVRLITGAPKGLVYPLISSLRHPMLARTEHVYDACVLREYPDLLQDVDFGPVPGSRRRWRWRYRAKRNTVRSVQRLPLPEGKNAEWVKDEYLRWLPSFFAPLVKVTVSGDLVEFAAVSARAVMLRLRLNPERSSPGRQLLYIEGGWLASAHEGGRLEFREVLERRFVLAAIHEFRPSLPWALYRQSQARVHLLVMKAFARHLARAQSSAGISRSRQ